MDYVKRNPRKVIGAVLAGVAAALYALDQQDLAGLATMASAFFLGGGVMKQDTGSAGK